MFTHPQRLRAVSSNSAGTLAQWSSCRRACCKISRFLHTPLGIATLRTQRRVPRAIAGPRTGTVKAERLGAGRHQQPRLTAPTEHQEPQAATVGHRGARRGRRCRGSASLCRVRWRARPLRAVVGVDASLSDVRQRVRVKRLAMAHLLCARTPTAAPKQSGRASGTRVGRARVRAW